MDKEIKNYIKKIAEPRRKRAEDLHQLIVALFPHAKLSIKNKMPNYQFGPNILSWGSQKSYLSIYTCSAERIAEFKKKFPKIQSGVGCLNFKDSDDFPLEALKEVIRNGLAPGSDILKLERLRIESAKNVAVVTTKKSK